MCCTDAAGKLDVHKPSSRAVVVVVGGIVGVVGGVGVGAVVVVVVGISL